MKGWKSLEITPKWAISYNSIVNGTWYYSYSYDLILLVLAIWGRDIHASHAMQPGHGSGTPRRAESSPGQTPAECPRRRLSSGLQKVFYSSSTCPCQPLSTTRQRGLRKRRSFPEVAVMFWVSLSSNVSADVDCVTYCYILIELLQLDFSVLNPSPVQLPSLYNYLIRLKLDM